MFFRQQRRLGRQFVDQSIMFWWLNSEHRCCLGNAPQGVTELCLEECVLPAQLVRLHSLHKQTHTHRDTQTDTLHRRLLTRVLMSASLSPSCVWRSVCCLRSSSTSSLSCVSSSVCSPFTCEPSPWLLDWLWFSLPEVITTHSVKMSDSTGNVTWMLMLFT